MTTKAFTKEGLVEALFDLDIADSIVRTVDDQVANSVLYKQKLLGADPGTAYWVFRDAGDNEGLDAARKRFIETDPRTAYWAFRDAGDNEGLDIARKRFIETYPGTAYRAFRDAGDNEGLQQLAVGQNL